MSFHFYFLISHFFHFSFGAKRLSTISQFQSCLYHDMLHTVACKSAIRGNDKNSQQELQALAERVYGDETIRHCPHGRPVAFEIKRSSIDRQFGRLE